MDEKTFRAALTRIFGANGMTRYLSYEKTEKFVRLTERMLTENEKYNLTAITAPEQIALLHYADSLTLAALLTKGAKVIDVGTGAGFPALPLAIAREDLSVTAADATEKRVRYVEETAALLGLSNLTARTLRAECGAREKDLREAFDVACARGVAPLRVLCEYCLPYVRVGGMFIAMKGQNAQTEVSQAKRAIAMLGGRLREVRPTPLAGGPEVVTHSLVIIDKIAATNAQYPRENAQIVKKPL